MSNHSLGFGFGKYSCFTVRSPRQGSCVLPILEDRVCLGVAGAKEPDVWSQEVAQSSRTDQLGDVVFPRVG